MKVKLLKLFSVTGLLTMSASAFAAGACCVAGGLCCGLGLPCCL
jgi:hypothetical protein